MDGASQADERYQGGAALRIRRTGRSRRSRGQALFKQSKLRKARNQEARGVITVGSFEASVIGLTLRRARYVK